MAKYLTTPNILWRIENFSTVKKKMGPVIRFMGLKFHMKLQHYMDSGARKLYLILVCQNAPQTSSPCKFEITSCLPHNGIPYLQKTGTYDLIHNESCIWSEFISSISSTFGQKKDVAFLITITPNIDCGKIIAIKQSSEEIIEMTPSEVSLNEDIGSLLNNPECSDFTLECGERSFPVHKAVLSARSHFFAGMFRSDMKESSANGSIIKDMEPDILEVVLRYIYTGKIPHLPMDSLQKVYAAADRLILEPLKMKCYSLLINNITDESEENSEKETELKKSESDDQPRENEKVENDARKRQMLRDLFMSREWKLLNEQFPHEALEMCKPFLFPSM